MPTDPASTGLDRTLPGHFPIGTLRIGPDNSIVRLVDRRDNGNNGQSTPEAISSNLAWSLMYSALRCL